MMVTPCKHLIHSYNLFAVANSNYPDLTKIRNETFVHSLWYPSEVFKIQPQIRQKKWLKIVKQVVSKKALERLNLRDDEKDNNVPPVQPDDPNATILGPPTKKENIVTRDESLRLLFWNVGKAGLSPTDRPRSKKILDIFKDNDIDVAGICEADFNAEETSHVQKLYAPNGGMYNLYCGQHRKDTVRRQNLIDVVLFVKKSLSHRIKVYSNDCSDLNLHRDETGLMSGNIPNIWCQADNSTVFICMNYREKYHYSEVFNKRNKRNEEKRIFKPLLAQKAAIFELAGQVCLAEHLAKEESSRIKAESIKNKVRVVLMGDMNFDLRKADQLNQKSNDRTAMNVFRNTLLSSEGAYLFHVNSDFGGYTYKTSKTQIDHAYVTRDVRVGKCSRVDTKLSDHFPIVINIMYTVTENQENLKRVKSLQSSPVIKQEIKKEPL